MSRIQNKIRQKRFMVKEGEPLFLHVESPMGHRYELKVFNASVNGLGLIISFDKVSDPTDLEVGQIIPDSKLLAKDESYTLGRMVIQRREKVQNFLLLGMMCIDSKISLGGKLSRYFEELSEGKDNPFSFELGSEKFNLATFTESEFDHPDIFEKCRQYKFLHEDLKKSSLYQYYSTRLSQEGSRAVYRLSGSKRKIDCVSFASYDYLGFAQHPEVIAATVEATEKYGVSSQGTMILAGKTILHEELESNISRFFDKEDTVLFNTGFATNVGVISSLIRINDLIISDIYVHASMHDGILSSKGKHRFFKHNNLDNLIRLLEENRKDVNGCLILTEGVYSMEGTIPNIKKIVKIAEKYNARIYIDECHSLGVFGPQGKGICAKEGVLEDIDLFMGSFSKGLGVGAAGFLCGSKEVIEWVRFFSRPAMFSAALPIPVVAAANKVLELLSKNKTQIKKLRENIEYFRASLDKNDIQTTSHPESPIISIVVGNQERLSAMNEVMLSHGIFVNCILFPAVPINGSRFRFSITVNHSKSDIDLAINALMIAIEKTKHMDNMSSNSEESSNHKILRLKNYVK